LGLDESIFYEAENAFGTFRSATANAQYAMVIFAFIIPLLSSTAARTQLKLNSMIYIGICLVCMSLTVLANMRAAAAFVGLLTIMYSVMFAVFYRRSFRYAKYLNRFSIAAVVFLLGFGTIIGVQNITEDFQEASNASSEQVLSGAVFNRLGAWQLGLDLLSRKSWIIGYGHGGTESNMIATGAVRTASGWKGGGHLHSLYLMLPLLYGWIGSFAFMGLFLVPLARAFRIIRKLSFDNLGVVVNLGFFVSIGIWLLDEIKSGSMVQSMNFTMLAFIWLGWAVAAQRTLRFNAIMRR
jgi:O-antigen ligase